MGYYIKSVEDGDKLTCFKVVVDGNKLTISEKDGLPVVSITGSTSIVADRMLAYLHRMPGWETPEDLSYSMLFSKARVTISSNATVQVKVEGPGNLRIDQPTYDFFNLLAGKLSDNLKDRRKEVL